MRPGGEEELAALADGSLAPERRAELEAHVEASPILADRLAEQERAVALLQGAGDEVEAPAGLRARLDAAISAHPHATAFALGSPRLRWRPPRLRSRGRLRLARAA
jgi:anti-sigma factor RsiW